MAEEGVLRERKQNMYNVAYREATKQEHEVVMAYGKRLHRLVVAVVIGCVIVLALSVCGIVFFATNRPKDWVYVVVMLGIWCLFLLFCILKEKDYKYKAIVAREYKVGEATAVSKERIHYHRSLEHYVVFRNPDGSEDRYLIEKWIYDRVYVGADCRIVKFDRQGQRGLAFNPSVVVLK